MKTKRYELLRFNDIDWKVSLLAEAVILLECTGDITPARIHTCTYGIMDMLSDQVSDIVPSHHSIALFTELTVRELIQKLDHHFTDVRIGRNANETIRLPICYELEMDMMRVSDQTHLSVNEIIEKHLAGTYKATFTGFMPGFVYAEGLDDSLACERLETPRKMVANGSVGIGGSQIGIYSLASPGGWNIIGRTPTRLFDKGSQPPMRLEMGSTFQFFRIDQEKFDHWVH